MYSNIPVTHEFDGYDIPEENAEFIPSERMDNSAVTLPAGGLARLSTR